MQFAKALYQGATLHVAEKLSFSAICEGFVSGHDFSRADKANKMSWALATAESPDARKCLGRRLPERD
jgi:hypothetical protein